MNEVIKYIENVDEKWKESYIKLFEDIKVSISSEFEIMIQNDIPTFVVPLSLFPEGYLNNSKYPLPFVALAAQKNYISLYHMGLHSDKKLLNWFESEYKNRVITKLNMGKSCIRFTNVKNIPYDLIKELMDKVSVEQWIEMYTKNHKSESK